MFSVQQRDELCRECRRGWDRWLWRVGRLCAAIERRQARTRVDCMQSVTMAQRLPTEQQRLSMCRPVLVQSHELSDLLGVTHPGRPAEVTEEQKRSMSAAEAAKLGRPDL